MYNDKASPPPNYHFFYVASFRLGGHSATSGGVKSGSVTCLDNHVNEPNKHIFAEAYIPPPTPSDFQPAPSKCHSPM